MKKLIIIGCGGHAMSVVDSLDTSKYELIGFIDYDISKKSFCDYPIIGNSVKDIDDYKKYCYFIAIGDNIKRKKVYDKLIKENLEFINIIDKTSIVSNGVFLGRGCFIGKMAIVNVGVSIGDNVIINSKALIEHGTTIKNHVNISTNTTLNGDVFVDDETFVGSGAVINNLIKIGKRNVIGSGSVIIQDINDDNLVVGVPGRIVKKYK